LAIVIEFYRRICVRRDGDGANDNDIEITTAPSSREINDACRIFSRPCPMKYLILAGFSGIASMAIGIACYAVDKDGSMVGCQSSWGDILADSIGVLIGEIMIFLGLWLKFGLFYDVS